MHHTGHGIGFRRHEPIPSLVPNSKIVLKSGMVHSVEPAVSRYRTLGSG